MRRAIQFLALILIVATSSAWAQSPGGRRQASPAISRSAPGWHGSAIRGRSPEQARPRVGPRRGPGQRDNSWLCRPSYERQHRWLYLPLRHNYRHEQHNSFDWGALIGGVIVGYAMADRDRPAGVSRYDSVTGNLLYCPLCHRRAPDGANFCPYDQTDLQPPQQQ